ncbi:hypothetical protein DFJ63DRAFT_163084 [Scheffersomyces coipomensis]|uniref:uncharacterized protein n=1 Tax=Scheffersomyces coipomensis TaxID=1788519 RepID=UPI00315C9155
MSESIDQSKLTKKQRKALEFREKKTKEERVEAKEEKKKINEEKKIELSKQKEEKKEQEKKRKLEETEAAEAAAKAAEGEPKKKRKTRRGKKGKGVNEGKGPRFILFVGNLPFDIEQTELLSHFKNSNPDRVRIRQDKGIAFLEFDNDSQEIQSKMELSLKMHHTILRNRKINVELTVGGGGNSANRLSKLKDKNDKLLEERKQRVIEARKNEAKKVKTTDNTESTTANESRPASNIHPSRAALIN